MSDMHLTSIEGGFLAFGLRLCFATGVVLRVEEVLALRLHLSATDEGLKLAGFLPKTAETLGF